MKYSKQMILEAIQHWENELDRINEREAAENIESIEREFGKDIEREIDALGSALDEDEDSDNSVKAHKKEIYAAAIEAISAIKSDEDLKVIAAKLEQAKQELEKKGQDASKIDKALSMIKKTFGVAGTTLDGINKWWTRFKVFTKVLLAAIILALGCIITYYGQNVKDYLVIKAHKPTEIAQKVEDSALVKGASKTWGVAKDLTHKVASKLGFGGEEKIDDGRDAFIKAKSERDYHRAKERHDRRGIGGATKADAAKSKKELAAAEKKVDQTRKYHRQQQQKIKQQQAAKAAKTAKQKK